MILLLITGWGLSITTRELFTDQAERVIDCADPRGITELGACELAAVIEICDKELR